MLTVTIGYDYALPIRAIPFCSHGFINALNVAEFLANPESFPAEYDAGTQQDIDHPLTRYESPPTPFRIDVLGKKNALHPGIFHSLPHTVMAAMDSEDPLASIKALPAGIFVWLKDIKLLFDFLNFKFDEQEFKTCGHISRFRQWMDDPFLNIDKYTTELIMEGMNQAQLPAITKKVRRSGMGGTDPHIQQLANVEVKKFFVAHARFPKKKEIAPLIAKITSKKVATVMREFKSPKSRK